MTDLFGYEAPQRQFRDIRDQRPSVAEQKAILCKTLGELLRTTPTRHKQCQYQRNTRMERQSREGAESVCKSAIQRQRVADSY